ncbi:MAG TPA: AAA family ATPase [Solirubrobacteraceae bacterium]|nr:AAA family ATPase [Solirubrobacteraceae bacterium]
MRLLEREEGLATLSSAHRAAAAGDGRVVLVSGEPGIGKTAVVTSFLASLGEGARVLLGTCDDLSIPRPLGPIRDLTGRVSWPLDAALRGGAAPHEIQALLIDELELTPRPTVLVLEDVHWADEATLDLVTVLLRRVRTLPALLVLTFRPGEAPPGHRLHAVLGAVPPERSATLALQPLSRDAVATLAGEDADAVYAASGGNAFYVTELLASGAAADPPPSVANAVVGRASRLADDARSLLELVSIVPNRMPTGLLDAVMPAWAAAAEEPERRLLLEVDATSVRFRHELARHAIRSSVPVATRRRLHREILAVLLDTAGDPADVVHHAEGAGDEDVVAEYAVVAARRAAALHSNREAYAHYRRATTFLGRLPTGERATVLEDFANAAYLMGRADEALPAIDRAIAHHRAEGDEPAAGRCIRIRSRLQWYEGDGRGARRSAREAIAALEPLGDSAELARAYSGLAQVEMLASRFDESLASSARAVALADRLGDRRTRAHALVNIGSVRIQLDAADTATLLEAHAAADEAGDPHEAVRALIALTYGHLCWGMPDPARQWGERARAYAREHEVVSLGSYNNVLLAWLCLRAGDWDDAERLTRHELDRGATVTQILARTVLAELAVRRGDPDAVELLADVAARTDRTGEPKRIGPVLELEVEWALTRGTPMPTARLERAAEVFGPRRDRPGHDGARLAAWAAVAGVELGIAADAPPPFGAMVRREWRAAADAFAAVGWRYDRALMLSLLDDEHALVEALETGRGLGADPLTKRVARRLRELGLRVPPGPRRTTRANPAGLTARQLEVLPLLVEGLTNAEIAERLVVSPRTAEHHVAALLGKLGASTRREAARRAAELQLVATD